MTHHYCAIAPGWVYPHLVLRLILFERWDYSFSDGSVGGPVGVDRWFP